MNIIQIMGKKEDRVIHVASVIVEDLVMSEEVARAAGSVEAGPCQ